VTDLRDKTIGISYFGTSTHMVAEGILRYYSMVAGKDVNITPSGDDENGRLDEAKRNPGNLGLLHYSITQLFVH